MIIGVPKETFPGERRVALIPAGVAALVKEGHEVRVESAAGRSAGFPDDVYREKGATVLDARDEVFASEILLHVRTLGANAPQWEEDLARYREGQVVIGTCDPLGSPQPIGKLAKRKALLFALELIPRITRAQSMDVLSSMATIAGYRAVLTAAVELPKMFPMMMTAAGTLAPAKVFVIGAGVAGLQAIATARRLGAVVEAYDVRPVVREQVESLGAKFVEMKLEAEETETKGGYARELGEDFYRRQRELMAEVVRRSDVVITTAAIPGKKSPELVTAEMVEQMPPGSVIVDLAAERGGNCQLTQADQRVTAHDVTILGPTNTPSEAPYHASQMFSKNVTTLLAHLIRDGQLHIDLGDEITRETLTTREGDVIHPRLRELLGLPPLEPPGEGAAETPQPSPEPSVGGGETSSEPPQETP